MKIKVIEKNYEDVLAMPQPRHCKPMRQYALIWKILKAACRVLLFFSKFSYEKIGVEKLKEGEPCLVLMNHSSFIALEIAVFLLGDSEYHIVTTLDGFVGKSWLMRLLGCIPIKKFINDIALVRDLCYTVKKLQASVLIYPEASYSFDGTATSLPEEIKEKSMEELNAVLEKGYLKSLTGCDGKIDYRLKPQASYSLYSDFSWYEIGDMISIGDEKIQYYCFPKNEENIAAKTRLAAEELYKLMKNAKERQ